MMCGKKNKMREIERVFEDPKVMAVVHDAQIVDEKTFIFRSNHFCSGEIAEQASGRI